MLSPIHFNWQAHFAGDDFGAGSASGHDVVAIQTRLNALGASPPLELDGAVGPMTQAAIAAFQRAHGLTPDGVVGPITLAALGLSSSPAIPSATTKTPKSPSKVSVPAFKGFAALPAADQRAFVKAAQWIAPGEPDAPQWLASIIDFESNRTWSPSVRNASSGATGLIQFLPSTARGIGTTVEALAAMPFAQQLEYVKKYFADYTKTRGRIHSLADMYLSVFAPVGVGKAPTTVLFTAGQAGYDQNTGLDRGNKGAITVADVASAPASRLLSVASIPPILVTMGVSVAAIALAMGAATLWLFRTRIFA